MYSTTGIPAMINREGNRREHEGKVDFGKKDNIVWEWECTQGDVGAGSYLGSGVSIGKENKWGNLKSEGLL